MFKEGDILDYPILGLIVFELVPLVGVEKQVPVWQFQVFADESQNLGLGSKGIVTNHEFVVVFLNLHLI